MLSFCWTCFLSLLIILYIFINPFNNGYLKDVSWNHTMKRFYCSPCRPPNSNYNVFTTQQWSKAELSREWRCSTNKNNKKYCFLASCESGKKKFGMIEQLYKQPFASKEFPWTALHVFKVEWFDFPFGLWSAENLTEKRTFILLSHVFTTFNSCNWWLCHAVPHTRTLQWYS